MLFLRRCISKSTNKKFKILNSSKSVSDHTPFINGHPFTDLFFFVIFLITLKKNSIAFFKFSYSWILWSTIWLVKFIFDVLLVLLLLFSYCVWLTFKVPNLKKKLKQSENQSICQIFEYLQHFRSNLKEREPPASTDRLAEVVPSCSPWFILKNL